MNNRVWMPRRVTIQWDHEDGPLMVMSNSAPHWLTWLERLKLMLRLTTPDAINAYRIINPRIERFK